MDSENAPNDGGLLAEVREVFARAPRIDVDVAIHNVIPRRVLRITSVTVIDAYDVVRLEYEVVPVDEPPNRDSARASRRIGPDTWRLLGRDDLGNRYEDRGGTYGVPEDGLLADGDRDLSPAPPPDASWLEIGFHTIGDPEGFEHAQHVPKINLPLTYLYSEQA